VDWRKKNGFDDLESNNNEWIEYNYPIEIIEDKEGIPGNYN
jgi:hypothetical protein